MFFFRSFPPLLSFSLFPSPTLSHSHLSPFPSPRPQLSSRKPRTGQRPNAPKRSQNNLKIVKQTIYNDISSSKVRLFVRRGQSIKYLLPNSVINYIELNRLVSDRLRGRVLRMGRGVRGSRRLISSLLLFFPSPPYDFPVPFFDHQPPTPTASRPPNTPDMQIHTNGTRFVRRRAVPTA